MDTTDLSEYLTEGMITEGIIEHWGNYQTLKEEGE